MNTKMVILDAATTTALAIGDRAPGEPDWNALSQMGDLTVHARTRPDQVIERARGASIVWTNKVWIGEEEMEQLPDLQYIGLTSTGTNAVDLKAAKRHSITVTNVPAYSTASVAQHTIALLLELAIHLSEQARLARDGTWSSQPDFSIYSGTITELAGKNFGMIGCGDIACATARIAQAMGMKILVHSRTRKETDFPCEWMSREEILPASDVLSLHCPLTDETRHLICAETLAQMKSGAFLLNTGRGPLVDEAAVAQSLKEGHLGGYGADVTSTEPPPRDHPLLDCPNVVLTPHVAWASQEARCRLVQTLQDNLQAYREGRPINVVT